MAAAKAAISSAGSFSIIARRCPRQLAVGLDVVRPGSVTATSATRLSVEIPSMFYQPGLINTIPGPGPS